jgi:DNA-binding NarL/FixJ family response regulator
MARIGILIADDHAVVREGLARLVADQADMYVTAQAADGGEALEAAKRTDPAVSLLDMRMPGLGGVALIRKLRESCPRTRVLVLSMYEDPHYSRAALAAGAHAYLPKRISSQQLLGAIRALHAGEKLPAADGGEAAPNSEREPLSAREREIMRLIMQGQTSREIGLTLGISKSSIDTYRARLFRKLGVDSRAELFARLAGNGEDERGT